MKQTYNLKFLLTNKKVSDQLVHNFRKEAVQFLVNLCTHTMEKSTVNSLFGHCLRCQSPNYKADCPEFSGALFQKILEKPVAYKHLPAKKAYIAKLQ